MPIPAKPCPGLFSEGTLNALEVNRDRAQWLAHPCALCGQQVGARLEKGKWIPEQHWPSVQYKERSRRNEKRGPRTATTVTSIS